MISNAISEYKSQIERQQSHKELVFNAKEDIITIKGDKGRILQVISNLLGNAVKFTEEGDSIVVSAEKKEDDDAVIISVTDTGIGMNAEIFPRLFTKFASKSKRGGTGLGLYISKIIVDTHGGMIWAENNPDGNGASITFNLPLATKAHAPG